MLLRASGICKSGWSHRHGRRGMCRVGAANSKFLPSSRSHMVLNSYEGEYYWGKPPQDEFGKTRTSTSASWHDEARELHRNTENAPSPSDLFAVLLTGDSCTADRPRLFPETSANVLLRLASWHTDNQSHLDPSSLQASIAFIQSQMFLDTSLMLPSDMANILWSLATLKGSNPDSTGSTDVHTVQDPVSSTFLDGVVAWGMSQAAEADESGTMGGLAQWSPADTVTMIWGYCALVAEEQAQALKGASYVAASENLPEERAALLGWMSKQLTRLLKDLPPNTFQPVDLVDVVWGLAAVGHRSVETWNLLEALSYEVYRQMSNRHSGTAPFLPPDLVKLIRGFADLKYKEGVAARMLDTVAGYVVKRIKSKSVYAISKPNEILAFLGAYRDIDYVSVALPELINATAMQLTREIASHNDALGKQQHQVLTPFNQSSLPALEESLSPEEVAAHQEEQYAVCVALLAGSWVMYMPSGTAAALLKVYHSFGFYPGPSLVTSLLLSTFHQLDVASPDSVTTIMTMMAEFRHHPGPGVLDSLLAAVSQKQYMYSGRQLAMVLCSCATLAHQPPQSLVSAACEACILGGGDSSSSSSSGGTDSNGDEVWSSNDSTLAPHEVSSLLFALVFSRQVTIQLFGLACVSMVGSFGAASASIQSSRQVASQAGKRSALLGLAAAGLVLGGEGREMMEEVLPASNVKTVNGALAEYLFTWADSLARSASSAACKTRVVDAVTRLGLAEKVVKGPVRFLDVDLSKAAVAVMLDPNQDVEGSSSEVGGLPGGPSPRLVLFEVCDRGQVASNNAEVVLGEAWFRHRVLLAVGAMRTVPLSASMLAMLSPEDCASYVAGRMEEAGLKVPVAAPR